MSGGTAAPSLGDVVGAAAFAVGLATAWLYVAGWSYAYHYFDRFRIPLLLAEIPREHLFVYGGLTIWKNPLAAAIVALLGLTLAIACIRYRARLGRSWLAGIVTLSVLVLFVLARLAGTHTAAADAAHQRATDYGAYPRVMIAGAPQTLPGPLAATLAEGCARLVLATDDRLFLIRPRRGMPALELNTVVLAWDEVEALTVSGQYTSCP